MVFFCLFSAQQLTINLLETLTKSAVITYDQLKTGMLRLFDDIEDIQLDVPNVYEQLQTLLKQLGEKKILNHDITSNAPQKGRKRITSEGENNKQEKD
jgi:programmed cell death protein 4